MPGSHPAASLTGCVIMGKSLNFSGPQFPPVQNGHDSGYLRPAVRMWRVKSLAQGLAHGRCVSALVFRLLLLLLPGEGLRGGGQALSSCVLACSGRVTGWAHGQGALPVLAVAVHVSSQGSAQIKGGLWRWTPTFGFPPRHLPAMGLWASDVLFASFVLMIHFRLVGKVELQYSKTPTLPVSSLGPWIQLQAPVLCPAFPMVATGLDLASRLPSQVFLLLLPLEGFANDRVIALNPGSTLQSLGELSRMLLPQPPAPSQTLAWVPLVWGGASLSTGLSWPAGVVHCFTGCCKWHHGKQPAAASLRQCGCSPCGRVESWSRLLVSPLRLSFCDGAAPELPTHILVAVQVVPVGTAANSAAMNILERVSLCTAARISLGHMPHSGNAGPSKLLCSAFVPACFPAVPDGSLGSVLLQSLLKQFTQP